MTDMIESSKNPVKSWEKTIRIGDLTKTVKVREIENGFIIKLNKYGNISTKDGKSEYVDITKEFFSDTNPLAVKEMDVMSEAKETAKSLGIDLMFE